MKVFIFEGIATSGKSTLIRLIASLNGDVATCVVNEDETHIPIMNKTGEDCADFFIKLINEKLSKDKDLLIFDRLYLTQAFRAKKSISSYESVENLLFRHEALTVFLKVEENEIKKRILKASEHRETYWKKYLKTKGKSMDEIANYYANQQANQLELLKTSKVPYIIFDTTNNNYEEIANKIMLLIKK